MIKTPLSTVIGGAFWTPGATVIGGNTPTFDQQIQKLFANGEQGFFYNPNDLSTMYQDAAGTIPVTAVGQAVGLMLDKSKGLSLLPHSLQPALSLSGTGAAEIRPDNTFYIMRGSAGNSGAINIPTSPNKGYKLVIEILSGNSISIRTGPGTTVLILQPSYGKFSLHVNMTSFDYLRFVNTVDNQESVFKVHSLDEIKGNHAYQTTSASRPILRKNAVTGANYLEFDGTDDFLQTANIDFTATDKVSLFAGVRKLSDSSQGLLTELGNIVNNSFLAHVGGGSGIESYTFGSRGNGLYSYAILTKSANPTLTAPHSSVVSAKSDISSNISYIKANGHAVTSSIDQGTGNYGNYPLYIGRRGGITLPFNGHIYGLIGVGKLVTDNETVAIEKELAKRVGVTINV